MFTKEEKSVSWFCFYLSRIIFCVCVWGKIRQCGSVQNLALFLWPCVNFPGVWSFYQSSNKQYLCCPLILLHRVYLFTSLEKKKRNQFNLATKYCMVVEKNNTISEFNHLYSNVLFHMDYVKINSCKLSVLRWKVTKCRLREILIKEASINAMLSHIETKLTEQQKNQYYDPVLI